MKYAVQVVSEDGRKALPPAVVEAKDEAGAKELYLELQETGASELGDLTEWTVTEEIPDGLEDIEESDDDGTTRAEGLGEVTK